MGRLAPALVGQLSNSRTSVLAFGVAIAYALAVATFFVLRPFGHWSENDTVVLSDAIAWMTRTEHLVPQAGFVYPHGYAYQVVSTFLLAFTGLTISNLQQVLSPFVAAVLVAPVAWMAYRELAGGVRAGTLATLILLLQPEFLFVVLRGSHEKVSRVLMLLALWLLARSFRSPGRPGHVAILLVLFYAASYGVIASNNLFATSFIVALGTALVLSWLLSRVWGTSSRRLTAPVTYRLLWTTTCLVCLLYVFDFYVYSPASYEVNVYREIWEKVTQLFHKTVVTQEQPPAGEPYAIVERSWISLRAYLAVSLGDWLLIAGAFLYWLRDGWTWVLRRRGPPSQIAWLVWVLFGAFALQCAQAVVVDFSGALATNLQYRAFESFVLVAVVVLARGLVDTMRSEGRLARLAQVATAGLIGCLAVTGILKAGNEPLLSNKWMFYTPEEMQALRWADTNARNASIWTELDERVKSGYELAVTMDIAPEERQPNGNRLDHYAPTPEDRDFLVTDITRARAVRWNTQAFPPTAQIRAYDNGSAQIYHVLRLSPYER